MGVKRAKRPCSQSANRNLQVVTCFVAAISPSLYGLSYDTRSNGHPIMNRYCIVLATMTASLCANPANSDSIANTGISANGYGLGWVLPSFFLACFAFWALVMFLGYREYKDSHRPPPETPQQN